MSAIRELACAPPGLRPSRILIGPHASGARPADWFGSRGARRVITLIDDGALTAWPRLREVCGEPLSMPGGERCKHFASLEHVLRALVQRGVDRDSTLLVVGGGAMCDLGGLAAALCVRGIELVLVPTTLLAMVDASVGGKTAIDLPEGKNLVGAFWPAREVWIDPQFATTESDPQFASGLGEIAKVALGLDADLFDLCEREAEALRARDPAILRLAVDCAVTAKIGIVERDPLEKDERRLLNLGHTLGHALEAHSGYARPHGLAVAQGLHHVLDLAGERGLLAVDERQRGHAVLTRLGLPAESLPPMSELLPFVSRDKKRSGAVLAAVLPTGIGRSQVIAMSPREFLGL